MCERVEWMFSFYVYTKFSKAWRRNGLRRVGSFYLSKVVGKFVRVRNGNIVDPTRNLGGATCCSCMRQGCLSGMCTPGDSNLGG